MANGSIRFMYLRDQNQAPIGCLAILLLNKKLVQYGVSVQNPIDEFDRTLARDLAAGRILTNPGMVSARGLSGIHDITRAVMSDLSKDSDAPERAQRAAKRWLKANPTR